MLLWMLVILLKSDYNYLDYKQIYKQKFFNPDKPKKF